MVAYVKSLRANSKQARNQIGTAEGAKIILRGAESFLTMSSTFKLCAKYFWLGA